MDKDFLEQLKKLGNHDELKKLMHDGKAIVYQTVEFTKLKAIEEDTGDGDGSLFIYEITGYASTIDVDRMNEIVEPTAFNSSIATYMKFPVIHTNHDMWMSGTPIGKTFEYLLDEKGLLVTAKLVNTAKGREVATLVEAGIMRAFSIGFNVKEMTFGDRVTPNKILDLELIEISVVSSPANTEAVIEQAEAKGITIKSLKPGAPAIGKGVDVMTPEELKALQDEQLAQATEQKKVIVTIADVKKEHDTMSRTLAEMQTAVDNASGDRAETNRLVDKMSGDFLKAQEKLDQAIEDMKIFKHPAKLLPVMSVKDILQRTDPELDMVLSASDAGKAKHFKTMNDDLIFLDALMFASAKNAGTPYGTGEYAEHRSRRITELKFYDEVNEFAKSLEAGTSNEGAEWVPTDLSTQLEELYRLNRSVAGLFDEFEMPTNPFDWPLTTSEPVAQLVTERTTVITAYADSVEETPGTDKMTFTASKARARIQLSAELTEDAAFAVLPWAQKRAGLSLVDAIEECIINGDDNGTHRDADSQGTNDFRNAFDGLRFHSNAKSTEIDGANGALTPVMMRNARAGMLKYGVRIQDLAWIVSPRSYLFSMLANTNFSDFRTLDKYGPAATVLTGEQAKFDAAPVIVSEYARDDLNDAGVQDGVTEDKAVMNLVNRPQWMIGNKRGVTVSVEKNVPFDVFTVFAFKRMDFQTFRSGTSDNNVAGVLDYLTQ